MLVPVVAPEEYGSYFSVAELVVLLEKRAQTNESLRKVLKRWAENPKIRLRFYYRPTYNIFFPEVTFHLDDVLNLATRFGYARLAPGLLEETKEARAGMRPSTDPVTWQDRRPRGVGGVRAAL